jgi:hypothetical protein
MNTTITQRAFIGNMFAQISLAVLLLAIAALALGVPQPVRAEQTSTVSYQGKWKWLTGKFKDRDPGSVTSVIVQHEPTLYKATFTFGKDKYHIDFKAEKKGAETLLTGATDVNKKPFSFDGKLHPDGAIAGSFSNGTDKGELTLTVAKANK